MLGIKSNKNNNKKLFFCVLDILFIRLRSLRLKNKFSIARNSVNKNSLILKLCTLIIFRTEIHTNFSNIHFRKLIFNNLYASLPLKNRTQTLRYHTPPALTLQNPFTVQKIYVRNHVRTFEIENINEIISQKKSTMQKTIFIPYIKMCFVLRVFFSFVR